jgi:hypothetical protein
MNCSKHEKMNSEENGTPQRNQSQYESHPDSSAGTFHGLAGPAPAGGRSSSVGEVGGDSGRSASGIGRRAEHHGPAAAGTPGAGPLVDGEAPASTATW